MEEQSTFQWMSGGSSPTPPLHIPLKQWLVRPIRWSQMRELLKQFHYRGDAIGGSIKVCLGLYARDWMAGGAALGNPRHAAAYGCRLGEILELRRLVCHDDAPRNTESRFIGRIIWWLRKHTEYRLLISYADRSVGHSGTIYRASNFSLVGETGASSVLRYRGRDYHPRSLTIDRPYSVVLRHALAAGEASIIHGAPKNIYLYRLREGGK